jgi:predicted DNA-binding ribbon-helix-helix protein
MPDYRFYKVGEDGHVVSLRLERTFDDDATAIAYAEQLGAEGRIEIWEGTRMVDCVSFSAAPPDVAA